MCGTRIRYTKTIKYGAEKRMNIECDVLHVADFKWRRNGNEIKNSTRTSNTENECELKSIHLHKF